MRITSMFLFTSSSLLSIETVVFLTTIFVLPSTTAVVSGADYQVIHAGVEYTGVLRANHEPHDTSVLCKVLPQRAVDVL